MEPRSVARREPNRTDLQSDLHSLNQSVPEDLSLPSLGGRPPRVRGHAFRFFLVLPLYNSAGQRVFTDEQLTQLYFLFNSRFGGCLAASARSGAPFFGEYSPRGSEPVRDYHTITIVYANPIEACD